MATLIKRSVIAKCHKRCQKKAAQVHAAFTIGGEVVEVVVEGVVFLQYLSEYTSQKPKTLEKELSSLPRFWYEANQVLLLLH